MGNHMFSSGRTRVLVAVFILGSMPALQGEPTVVTWKGGAGIWSDPDNWEPGVVPMNTTDVFFEAIIDGGKVEASTVTLDKGISLSGIALNEGDTLRQHFNTLHIIHTPSIVNDGLWEIASTIISPSAELHFHQPIMLEGNGDWVLNGSQSRINVRGGLTTLASNSTIRGSGLIRLYGNTFVNHGLFRQSEGSLRIQGAGGTFEHYGTMVATDDYMSFSYGTFVNAGGTIIAQNEATFSMGTDATFIGGRYVTEGTGEIRIASGAILENVQLDGTVLHSGNMHMTIRGELNHNGQWRSLHTGFTGANSVTFEDSAVISGDGDMFLGCQYERIQFLTDGSILTLEADRTLRGRGSILNNTGGMVNRGLIRQEGTVSMTIDPNHLGFVNEGTLASIGTGRLRLIDGTFDNSKGAIEALDGGIVQLGPTAHIFGGTIASTRTGFIVFDSLGETPPVLSDLLLEGVAVQQGSHDVIIDGHLINNSSWSVNHLNTNYVPVILLRNGSVVDGEGQIVLATLPDADAGIFSDGSVVRNGPGHTIRGYGKVLSGTGGMINEGLIRAEKGDLFISPGPEGFTNEGSLEVASGRIIHVDNGEFFSNYGSVQLMGATLLIGVGNYSQMGGCTSIDGILSASRVEISGGCLAGIGTITHDLINSSLVGVGSPVGTLTANGHYVQTRDGTLVITLGSSLTDTGNSQLNVGNSALLDGRLHVELIDDFEPEVGNEFTILTAAAVSGEFDAHSGTLISEGLALEPTYGAASVTLTAVAIDGLAVNDIHVGGGTFGTTDVVFTITLTEPNMSETVEVTVQTEDGTATVADNDYIPLGPTTVTFAPGETEKQVILKVINDGQAEPEEYFKLVLSDAVNADIVRSVGVAIIEESPQIDHEDWFILY